MNEIESNIGDNAVWISEFETTDRSGRYIAHLICAKMGNKPSHPHFIAYRELEKFDHFTIVRFINDSWPDNNPYCENILEFISDTAP